MSEKALTAITDIQHNVYVRASAGTGKTYTLTQRYLEIVERNLTDCSFTLQNILAITFTKAAALEMRTRIREELLKKSQTAEGVGADRLKTLLGQFDRANIMTIDALEGQIIRENPVEAVLDPNYTLLGEEEYRLKIKEEVRHFLLTMLDDGDYSYLRQSFEFRNIAKILSDLVQKDKREILQSDELLQFEGLGEGEDCLRRSGAMLNLYRKFEEYFNRKKDGNDILSFGDTARRAVELLQRDRGIAKKYQDMFRYIMVDEFQDTNANQRKLVYLLTGDATGAKISGDKLFIVGDSKQSIYRFRGAEVQVFNDVCQAIQEKGGNSYTLGTNRRSYPGVLNYVNEVFASGGWLPNYAEEKLEPFYKDARAEKPVLNIFDDAGGMNIEQMCRQEARAVAGYIKKVRKEMAAGAEENGIPRTNGRIAILLKVSTHLGAVTDALSEAHIPYSVVGDKDFYQQQEVQDLYNLFRFLRNPIEEDIPLLAVLRSPYFALSDEEISGFECAKGQNLWQCLLEKGTGARAVRAGSILSELVQAAKFLPPAELWQRVMRVMNVEFILLNQEEGREQNYNQLLANVEKLHKNCLEQCNLHGWGLAQWLDYLKDVMDESKERAADLPSSDAVEIMTMHKSKGLQFETVILPFLNTYKSGNDRDGFLLNTEHRKFALKTGDSNNRERDYSYLEELETGAEAQENARLFYVACTRAEKRLYLSGFCKAKDDKKSSNSQFMEMALAGAAMGSLLRGEMFAEEGETLSPGQVKYYELQGRARREKLDFGTASYFTPSRLQIYLHCQRQYYYQYCCGLPGLEERGEGDVCTGKGGDNLTPAERGTLLHKALELYHGDSGRAWAEAVKTCGFAEKTLVETRELYENYLQSELFQSIPAEHQREIPFRLPLQDGVAFGGVIDCLYRKDNGTYGIVDYKTGAVPDKLNEGYAMQLAIYARAVEKMRLGRVSELQLHYLQGCKKSSIIDKENVYAEALALAKEVQKKKYEEDFTVNPSHCGNCGYAYLCPFAGMRQEDGNPIGGEPVQGQGGMDS